MYFLRIYQILTLFEKVTDNSKAKHTSLIVAKEITLKNYVQQFEKPVNVIKIELKMMTRINT